MTYERTCITSGCDSTATCRWLCNIHYHRALRAKAELPPYMPSPSAESRFWPKVHKTETCWLWTGSIDTGGYGLFRVGALVKAHRFAYELMVGPIPEGLHLDHVRARGCTHRNCVNPAHLEPVTQAENTRRGDRWAMGQYERNRTHCEHGHPFDEENTRIRNGCWRVCRACHREQERERQRRQRGAA